MRAFLLLPILTAIVTPAVAQQTASVDLVASFVLGIADGSTFGSVGSHAVVMDESTPGVFDGSLADGTSFSFAVVDEGDCVFDVSFTEAGAFVFGLLVDGKQLKSAIYEKTGEHEGVFDYELSLNGGANLVQEVSPAGEHTPFSPDAPMTTSLTVADMQASIAAFQADYCPAAQ
jgi:hypothetical protein